MPPRGYNRRVTAASPVSNIEQKNARARAAMEDEDIIEFDGTSGGFPPLPDLPGFHVTWVRIWTQAVPDISSVQQYVRGLGYQPITPEDMPHFEHAYQSASLSNAAYDGIVIQHRDCIACKIPIERYHAIMRGMDAKAKRKRDELHQVPGEMPSGIQIKTFEHSSKPFALGPRTVPLGADE